MKLNKIFMALAAMAIVGCSSEDVSDFTAKKAVDDSRLVELNPNFVLAGVGEDDAITRTHWEFSGTSLVNKFLPIYAVDADGVTKLDKLADLKAQAVGLCWVGNGTVGTDVYTNYEFYHFGWLNKGATDAKFECDKLTNGACYNEITPSTGSKPNEAKTTDWGVAGLPTQAVKSGEDNLNYNSGIYKTDNKAIFGGKYIAYYPFNEEFTEVGTIPAKAITAFDDVAEDYTDPKVGHATFRYSAPVTIKGGDQAGGFGLYNLSTLVQLRVSSPATVTCTKTIDKIVLYSKDGKLLKQANLAADKIVAGKKGTELYAKTEGTRVITATFAAPVTVEKTNSGSVNSAYITVLPTTVTDLAILVHSTDGKWATVNKPNTIFDAGAARVIDITVNDDAFKADFIAVDEASLIQARNEARIAGGKRTITVIGDITLDGTNADTPSKYDFGKLTDADITIKGDAIIVPEDITLDIATNNTESDIRVLGKTCCTGTTGGRLNIKAGATLGNVTMEPTEMEPADAAEYKTYNPWVTYDGKATIAAGKTFDAQAGTVDVNSAVQHKGNINIAEGVTLTVINPGDLNFMGATVVNNGTIEVKKDAKFDITDKDGNASAEDGKNMTNNGKFIHNVDAQVGTAVQLMTMNEGSEYRCRVDDQIKLDDAYQKWLACSVIEIVGTGTDYNLGVAEKNINYQHNNKYIDIEVNATGNTTFTNPDLGSGDGDNKNIQVGNLTIMQGTTRIKFVTGKGQRSLTVNGNTDVESTATALAIWHSKKVTITKNLTASALFKYYGDKANVEGLAVGEDITVSGATFNADDVDALDITCKNFTLEKAATAKFGNRRDGDTKNMTVSGTITVPAGCEFNIHTANQVAGSVLATITCTKLIAQGSFPGGKPQVVAK